MVDFHLDIFLLRNFKTLTQFFCTQFLDFFLLHSLLHILSWIIITSNDKLSSNRKLLGCKAQCLLCYLIAYTLHFNDYTSRSDGEHISFRITFTFTHTHFGRLLGDRLVREDTDPNLTLTLHIACHGDTGSLNLAAGNPFRLQRLYAE